MKRFLIIVLLLVSAVGFAQVDVRKNAEAFSKGLESKYKDDTEGAIKHFEEALRFMPDDAASMYELSEQYVKANRVDDGFAMSKKAAELDPDNKWYQMRLAVFYRNREQYDEFIRIYEPLTARYPDDVNMLSDLLDVYLAVENYDKVMEKLELLEKQAGVNTRFYHMLAKIYMDKHKEKEALKLYERIKAIDPNDPYINISLLEYYEKKGKLDQAFEELIEAINNENLDFNTKANIYDYWFQKFQHEKGIDQQAFRAGRAFTEAYPDFHLGYGILAQYYMNRGDYEPCAAMSREVLKRDPSNYLGWQCLVMSEAPLMQVDSLKKHTAQALQYYPTQPVFYWYAGVACAIDKQDREAIAYFEKGRKFVADAKYQASFDSYLGDLYHSVGEEEKSFDAYERVLRVDPDNALVLNNFAYYLSLRKERLDEARTMAQHAVELEPDNAIYLDTYAWVLYELGEYQAAEKQMEKALKHLPQPDGTYYRHYADILDKVGKAAKAEEYRNKAKNLKDE